MLLSGGGVVTFGGSLLSELYGIEDPGTCARYTLNFSLLPKPLGFVAAFG